jgi:segregation and condensation protein B
LEQEKLKAIVENILLASDQPVTADDLQKTIMNGTEKATLQSILVELQEEYRSRSLQIEVVAEGYQLSTRHEYSDWVRKFLKLDKTTKLSQPSLDTLSIIAYKQPLTKQEVEEVRGVDCGGVIKTLLDKKIIGPAGRKKVPGRPIMYRTTRKFLEYFGLKDLSDLPTLEDLQDELSGDSDTSAQAEMDFDSSIAEQAGSEVAAAPSDQPVSTDSAEEIFSEEETAEPDGDVAAASTDDVEPEV